jgi:hypothetical protein
MVGPLGATVRQLQLIRSLSNFSIRADKSSFAQLVTAYGFGDDIPPIRKRDVVVVIERSSSTSCLIATLGSLFEKELRNAIDL